MTHYFRKAVSGLFFFLCFYNANSKILKVDDTGYSSPTIGGTQTLPMAIAAASPNDTILINITGTMIVFGPNLVFDKPLTILGPSAAHFSINANSWQVIFDVPAGNIIVDGIRFTSPAFLCGDYVSVQQGTNLTVRNCVFEGTQISGDGGAIKMMHNSVLKVENSSFFNCSATGNGGGIYVGPTNAATVINCTFFGNNAVNGGAICNDGDVTIVNSTFLNNTASGLGHAVRDNSNGPGTITEIQNNIFTSSVSPNLILSSSQSWVTNGGNVFSSSAGSLTFISLGPSDITGQSLGAIGLRANAVTDGYGLKYYPIISQTSPAVDNGIMNALVLPVDGRRAPRVIYGDNVLAPDAGAVEFTPWTNLSNSTAGFNTMWSTMNSSGFPGPKYMDFDISGGGPVNFNPPGTLNNFTSTAIDWIVDGFTQDGSKVPGPGSSPNTYTPAIYMVHIQNSSSNIISLTNPGLNSSISGLSLSNPNTIGIHVDGGQIHIYGNKIIASGPLGTDAIYLENNNNALIGGDLHHHRNVLGNQTNAGIHAFNNVTNIKGNFIGCNDIATTDQSSDKGVLGRGAICNIRGKVGMPSMNIISGNNTAQVEIQNGLFSIGGNIIGPDFTMNTLLGPCQYGIHAYYNTDGEIGGVTPGSMNVIGGNSTGVFLQGSNAVNVFGNFIGISPDGNSGFPSIPNSTGISIVDNGDANHFIGNGTRQARNYICNNTTIGIYLDNAYGHVIDGNFIGLKPSNTPAGNGSIGIHLANNSSGITVYGNVISNQGSAAAINFNGAGGSSVIENNKIGLDSTGIVSHPNLNGIDITSPNGSLSITDNLISGNTSSGINLSNCSYAIDISGNLIGLDATEMAVMPNGVGINANLCDALSVLNNTITGNTNDGIVLSDVSNFNVKGNFIGTNSVLTTGLGNGLLGIFGLGNSNNGMIGGLSAGEENTVANNGSAGILLMGNSQNIGILSNVIYGNAGLGIALTGNPGTPLANDVNDADAPGTVGNKGRNYPDNLSVSSCAGTTTLTGTLDKDVAGDYLIQVYRINPGAVDPSNHGEGNLKVYEILLNLPAGNSPISISLPGTIVLGDILSVTSSLNFSPNFETSEFSDTVLVRGGYSAIASVVSPVSCFGLSDGVVTVNHGGTGPFSYDWVNVISGISTGATTQTASLPAGTYFCWVTDISCTIGSDTIVVTEPGSISISATTYNVNCFGESTGAIDINAIGGTGGYLFDWDNDGTGDFDDPEDLSNFPAGFYNVTVQDANGCLQSGSGFIISQPGAISAFPTVTHESCVGLNDGSITVTAAGGTGGFNYQISSGGFSPSSTFTNLAPGNYPLDVQDANGCIVNLAATVNAGESVFADFIVSGTTACQNAPDFDLTDISTAASGISIWNWTLPSGSPSSAVSQNITGVYLFNAGPNSVTLQVTSNNGCTDDTIMTINADPAVFVDAGPDEIICLGDPFVQSAIVSGGAGGNIYDWQPSGHFIANGIEDADVTSTLENTIGYFEHILQVTDLNGCTDRDTMYLDIRSLPSVSAGIDNSVCQGSSYILSGSGSAISYTWDNGVIDGTPFSPVSTITYTVVGTDAAGCQNTDQVTIGVDLPVTVNAGPDLDECRPTAFNTVLNGIVTNASSVLWSTSGSGSWDNTLITNATYFYSGADASGANVTLTLTGNSGNSCPSASDDLTITFHNAPSAFAGSDFSVCASTPVNLNGGATDQIGVDWTGGSGTYSPDNISLNTNYSPSAAEISAGFVSLTFTAYSTNAACADATDDIVITLLTSPVANAGTDGSICNGQSFSLDGSASSGTITTYSWDEFLGPNIGSNAIENVSPVTTASYVLTTGNGSCNDFDTVQVTVISAPDAGFSYSPSIFCINDADPTPVSINTVGGIFSMPASSSINPSTGLISLSAIGAGTFDVVYTLSTPCFADDTIQIVVNSLPVVNAGNDTSFCAGGSVILNGTGSGGSLNWSSIGGFNSNANPESDTPTATDTYTFSVTDANGCTGTDTKLVTVNPIPTGTISGGGAFCEGDPIAGISVTANGYTGGGDWNVQFFQNTVPGMVATPSTGTYDYLGLASSGFAGTWTADITDIISGCVGAASGSVTISVNPEPTLSVASPFLVCSSVGAFDMDVYFAPVISGGTWSGTGVSGVNFNPFSVGVGSYNVVYTLPSGCDDTIQIDVVAAPNPTITGLDNAYCITDAPFMPTGTPAGGLWSIDGGTFTSMTSIDPSTLTQGTHSLSYQFTDGVTGCVGTSIPNGFIISNVPLDPIAVSNTTQSICGGASLLLTVSNPNSAGTSVQWYSDPAYTVNVGSTINFTTPVLTSSVVYYAVVQNAGCTSNPVIFNITVNNPQVSAGADLTICPGTQAQLNLTSAVGTISWSPGVSLSDSTIQNPIATPNVNTTYVVTVTSGPCSSSDSVTVSIDGSNPDCGIVPSYNAFSPDGDGVNDVWIIDAIFAHPDNRVAIFNRWGDKLVSFEDYDNVNVVWDGTYNGSMLPSGTYFYVVEYLDIDMQVSGWLQLTR